MLNGAAARLVQVNDIIIIMSYVQVTAEEALNHNPKVALMNEKNEIIEMIQEEEGKLLN